MPSPQQREWCVTSALEDIRGIIRFVRCGAPRDLTLEDFGVVKEVHWRHVGEGQGSYKLAEQIVHVGDSRGAYEVAEVDAAVDFEPAREAELPLVSLPAQTSQMFGAHKLGPQRLGACAAHAARRCRGILQPFRDAAANVREGRCPIKIRCQTVFQGIIMTIVALLVIGIICVTISMVMGPAKASPAAAAPAFSCLAEHEAAWPAQEKEWCCDHRGLGCPDFDCSEGLEDALAGWSMGKRKWCCIHDGSGCPASPLGEKQDGQPKLRGAGSSQDSPEAAERHGNGGEGGHSSEHSSEAGSAPRPSTALVCLGGLLVAVLVGALAFDARYQLGWFVGSPCESVLDQPLSCDAESAAATAATAADLGKESERSAGLASLLENTPATRQPSLVAEAGGSPVPAVPPAAQSA